MKNTVKITASGVISALAIVLMLGTNIPIMLYTVPALVGILFMIPAIEFTQNANRAHTVKTDRLFAEIFNL